MNDETHFTYLRKSILIFLCIFLTTGAVCSGLLLIFYKSELKTKSSLLEMQEINSVDIQGSSIKNIFDAVVSDLLFLSQQNELQQYLSSNNPAYLPEISKEYLAFSTQKRAYDQVRFLDQEGMEIVRVNFNHGTPSATDPGALQSKKGRYYFRDCFHLEQGEIYVSPFDLNIENGQIEQPLKPMIRFGTPVFDRHGNKRGIIVLNYLGEHLLSKLMLLESISEGTTMLLNADGYWLQAPEAGMAWGFMFNDPQRSFAFAYPSAWQTIRHRAHGQFITPAGLFTFRDIFPLEGEYVPSESPQAHGEDRLAHDATGCHRYHWYLVSFIPRQSLDTIAAFLKTKLFATGAGIFVIIALGAWWLAFSITKRRMYQAQLKVMALCDGLTGLPNRRLFHDRLASAIRHGKRYGSTFALLFIDLDGFKKINDSLGHKAGDALLCEVARRLERSVRKSDTVARMGGDEFAVIIPQLHEGSHALPIANKIIEALTAAVPLPQGTVNVGASIGISLFPDNSEDADELLKQADAAMYRSKKQGTNLCSYFSEKPAAGFA